jgi:AraC-like DNA-binding protein
MKESTLPRGGEWAPPSDRWCLLQLKNGVGYWQQPNGVRELLPGATLVLTGEARGSLLASQLSEVVITHFCLDPDNLIGLLNLGELRALERRASRESHSARMLPPVHPVSERFGELCRRSAEASLTTRLHLLQLFFELFADEAEGDPANSTQELFGRERLRHSLMQMAVSDFVGQSLSDLAPRMRCSRRHLSRLFREELGTSYRDKQTEVRMAKARQLLASSNIKLVEVALASGYHSYSLFAELFKRHFGLSPAKWRQQHGHNITRRLKTTLLPPL